LSVKKVLTVLKTIFHFKDLRDLLNIAFDLDLFVTLNSFEKVQKYWMIKAKET